MTERLDAIIFGATGFTGRVAVENAVRLYEGLRWGVAGRNRARLEALLEEVGRKVGADLAQVPVIQADVGDEDSLREMARRCRLVVNCCGPYRVYGEAVVKACIEAGTHHVDVSGEPQYVDGMQLKYDELARERKTYVVSTCGFESIPIDMGVAHAERNFPGTVNSVEAFWENAFEARGPTEPLLHYGTWESAVYAMKDGREMLQLDRKVNSLTPLPPLKPALKTKLLQRPGFLDSFFLPMPDTVAMRSQRLRFKFEQKRPAQIAFYVGFRSLFCTLVVPLCALLLLLLAQVPFTRRLLLRFPHVFSLGLISHRGPSEATRQGHRFSITFRVRGWAEGQTPSPDAEPRLETRTRVSGRDPFYGLTSRMLLLAGRTILEDAHKMPSSGGVLSPGAAFAQTSLIESLQREGLEFEVLK